MITAVFCLGSESRSGRMKAGAIGAPTRPAAAGQRFYLPEGRAMPSSRQKVATTCTYLSL